MINYEYYEEKYEHMPKRDGNNFFTGCNYSMCCIRCDGNHDSYGARRCWKSYRKKQYRERTEKLPKTRKQKVREHWRDNSAVESVNRSSPFGIIILISRRDSRTPLQKMEDLFKSKIEQGLYVIKETPTKKYWAPKTESFRIDAVDVNDIKLDNGFWYRPNDMVKHNFQTKVYTYGPSVHRFNHYTNEESWGKYLNAA